MAMIFAWTTAGRARLVNAQNDGVDAVRIAAIGLSEQHAAGGWAELEALPGQFKTVIATGGGAVDETLIHVTVQDTSTDAYDWRAFGLIADDGVLLGVYSQPDPIFSKTAGVVLAHAVDITLVDAIDPGSIDFGDAVFALPPATAERLGLVELATPAEVLAREPTRAATGAGVMGAIDPVERRGRRLARRAFYLALSR